jgi:UDP-N-acetylglucosamine 2-epimerase (non-hydrolysing)
MLIHLVAGARPNFMKISPLYREIKKYSNIDCCIIHTGQHYDFEMSQTFFDDLELPKPDYFLEAGSGSHAEQTGKIMMAFEKICQKDRPDWVFVVGDVNSTLACSITSKKLSIKVAHVEAGLRSFDLTMPEEINRIVTDAISDLFFVTEQSGVDNLLREGKSKEQVHLVGHVMIDNLFYQLNRIEQADNSSFATCKIKPKDQDYVFLTLHRPSNVDDQRSLEGVLCALRTISQDMPILFPIHPRTRKQLDLFGLSLPERVVQLPPLGFREALYLWKDARVVLTDSGGLQEETTALKIPCITIRENTERPITIEIGSNRLAGNKEKDIVAVYRSCIRDDPAQFNVPALWDGRAAERIIQVLLNY